ncbi:MAG TPA: hypothetical protein PK358_07955 [Spirochaetota bacterium]|nr:hypothetical protein [Spirochaetota bacterium]HPJ34753.1 hypothetical protein [Spirochaetota bacterium]
MFKRKKFSLMPIEVVLQSEKGGLNGSDSRSPASGIKALPSSVAEIFKAVR